MDEKESFRRLRWKGSGPSDEQDHEQGAPEDAPIVGQQLDERKSGPNYYLSLYPQRAEKWQPHRRAATLVAFGFRR